jgi:hypothetical protein
MGDRVIWIGFGLHIVSHKSTSYTVMKERGAHLPRNKTALLHLFYILFSTRVKVCVPRAYEYTPGEDN